MLDHSSELKARQHELEQQLAAAKEEAAEYRKLSEVDCHRANLADERYDALKSRIESAPVIYLAYKQDSYGDHLEGASSVPWRKQEGYAYATVRAVPVEEK